MERAVIYGRVSTDKQKYERQLSDLLSFAEGRYEIVKEFAEKISGFSKERPELGKMKSLLKSDKTIKVILCTEISRLGRNAGDTLQLIEEFTGDSINCYFHNINTFILDRNGKQSFATPVLIAVLASVAQWEAANMQERFASGKIHAVRNGYALLPILPYGYKKGEDKKVAINEEEAIIVRQIFDLCIAGYGTTKIANKLQADNTPTRLQLMKRQTLKSTKYDTIKDVEKIQWHENSVHCILTNTFYKGERKFKVAETDYLPGEKGYGIMNKNGSIKKKPVYEIFNVPAIIPEATWNLAQEKLQLRNNSASRVKKHFYLLKDMIACGSCGRFYVGRGRTGSDNFYYQCSSTLIGHNNSCGNGFIKLSTMENTFWKLFSNDSVVREAALHYKSNKIELEEDIVNLTSEHIVAKKKLALAEGSLDRIDKMKIEGEIDNEKYVYYKKDYTAKLKLIKKQILNLESKINMQTYALKQTSQPNELQKLIDTIGDNEIQRRELIKQIIDNITVYTLPNYNDVLACIINYKYTKDLRYVYFIRKGVKNEICWTKFMLSANNHIHTAKLNNNGDLKLLEIMYNDLKPVLINQ